MRRLGEILDLSGSDAALASREIGGLCADSRKVRPGDAFFAIPGVKSDGLAYAAQAVEKGAGGDRRRARARFRRAGVRARRRRAGRARPRRGALLSASQPELVVGITGTSGKTSVAAFVRQIWASTGYEAASLGTLGVVSRPITVYGSLTTPDPIALHETLDRLAGAGVTRLALEASSHGLDQKRLDGVRFAAGAFTNLSRDHMDYHATTEDYLAAKLRLFRDALAQGRAGRRRRRQRRRARASKTPPRSAACACSRSGPAAPICA